MAFVLLDRNKYSVLLVSDLQFWAGLGVPVVSVQSVAERGWRGWFEEVGLCRYAEGTFRPDPDQLAQCIGGTNMAK